MQPSNPGGSGIARLPRFRLVLLLATVASSGHKYKEGGAIAYLVLPEVVDGAAQGDFPAERRCQVADRLLEVRVLGDSAAPRGRGLGG